MKLAIMGDSHDHYENLDKAIDIANEKGCEVLLFDGDLIAPGNGAVALARFQGKVKFVFGNNDGEKFGLTQQFAKYPNLEIAGGFLDEEFDGVKVFMNHWPKYSELAAKSGDYDLCICGHTHEYLQQQFGKTVLVNPSSLHPFKATEPGFVIYDTQTRVLEHMLF